MGYHAQSYGGKGPLINKVSWILAAIGITMVVARMFVTIRKRRRMGEFWFTWDLAWILVATLLGFFSSVTATMATLYGIGNHGTIVAPEDIAPGLLWQWAADCLTILSSGFGKCALIAIYLDIQGHTSIAEQRFLKSIGWINVVYDIAQVVFIWFQCEPISKMWKVMEPGSCPRTHAVLSSGVAVGCVSGVSDVLLALYSIYIVYNLHMRTKYKIEISVWFLGGLLAGSAAFVKTTYIFSLETAKDQIYGIWPLLTWALVELWLIVIMGSMPPLAWVFKILGREIKRVAPMSTRTRTSRAGISQATDSPTPMQLGVFSKTGSGRHHVVKKGVSDTYIIGNASNEEILQDNAEAAGGIVRTTRVENGYEKSASLEDGGVGGYSSTAYAAAKPTEHF